LTIVILTPLILAVDYATRQLGFWWWLGVWGIFVAFNLLGLLIVPTFNMPLFGARQAAPRQCVDFDAGSHLIGGQCLASERCPADCQASSLGWACAGFGIVALSWAGATGWRQPYRTIWVMSYRAEQVAAGELHPQ
jgi:hypothetical protein